jgi:hypothetical protein
MQWIRRPIKAPHPSGRQRRNTLTIHYFGFKTRWLIDFVVDSKPSSDISRNARGGMVAPLERDCHRRGCRNG